MKRTRAVERFLRTGDYDPCHAAWPGDAFQRCCSGDIELRSALVQEVHRRSAGMHCPKVAAMDLQALTRQKVEPMVRGLFPSAEHEIVLSVLEKSVVFLTAENIESVILGASFPDIAWDLANLYLESIGAQLLGPEAKRILGLSDHTTCYVSATYFEEKDQFADFVVHEAAHVFHNCKRRTVGLPESNQGQWLLSIDYRKREEFAYACEFYSRILALSFGSKERQSLLNDLRTRLRVPMDRVDRALLLDILAEAVIARIGWKPILARCAPEKRDQAENIKRRSNSHSS